MRRIRYAVAMSLDGYIAGPQGEADWISKPDDPSVAMKFFTEFFPQFDTAIMGRRAYEVFGGAVQGMDTYVFSRTLSPGKREGVTVLGADGLTRLRELRERNGKDIWLFGGGSLFGSLASAGLVDSIELGVMPVMLGGGVPVMSGNTSRVKLRLTSCEHGPGAVSVKYALNPE